MEAAGFTALHGQASTINSRPAWVGFYTGRLQDLGAVVVEAAHVVLGDQVYLVAGVTPLAGTRLRGMSSSPRSVRSAAKPGTDGVQLLAAPSSRTADVFELAAAPALAVA